MAAQKGATLKIKKGDGGDPETFTAIAAIKSKTVNQNATQIDITTDDDVNVDGVSFSTSIPGIVAFSVAGSGIVKSKADFNGLQADFLAGTVANYEIELTNFGAWSGALYIQALNLTGEVDGAVTFDMTIANNGPVDYVAAA